MKKLLLLSLVLLSGCAATSDPNQLSAGVKNGMAACLKASNRTDLMAVSVPSASNVIANKMAAAAIKMNGGSSATTQLVRFLSASARPPVFVFGDDADIVAATVEAALAQLSASAVGSPQLLCVSSGVPLSTDARQAAKAAKIELLSVDD